MPTRRANLYIQMTYLAQYPQLKSSSETKGRVSGVDEFPIVGRPTHFFVDVENEFLEPEISQIGSDSRKNSTSSGGRSPTMGIKWNRSEAVPTKYEVSFVPLETGKLKVSMRRVENDFKDPPLI